MSRYAIISDVHGNLPALRAVLDDAAKHRAGRYIFAGDYYMCLHCPNEVAEAIRRLRNAFVIKWNNEPLTVQY